MAEEVVEEIEISPEIAFSRGMKDGLMFVERLEKLTSVLVEESITERHQDQLSKGFNRLNRFVEDLVVRNKREYEELTLDDLLSAFHFPQAAMPYIHESVIKLHSEHSPHSSFNNRRRVSSGEFRRESDQYLNSNNRRRGTALLLDRRISAGSSSTVLTNTSRSEEESENGGYEDDFEQSDDLEDTEDDIILEKRW